MKWHRSFRGTAVAGFLAFTLVELLVVLTIIALLAAMLLPVIMSAQQASDKTASLELVQALEKAVRIYALDSKGLPMPDKPEDPTTGSAGERIGFFVYDPSDQAPGLINDFVGSQKFSISVGDNVNEDLVVVDAWGNPIHYVVGDAKNKIGRPGYDSLLPQDLNKPKDADKPADESDWNKGDKTKYPYVYSTGNSDDDADWIYVKSD